VNDGLAHGRYFFMDVAKDGIALYQSDDSELHQPKPKTPSRRWRWRGVFREWFRQQCAVHVRSRHGSRRFKRRSLRSTSTRTLPLRSAGLHFYTPHVHNLAFLRTQAERIDRRLVTSGRRHRRERACSRS
jgi:hypothetical protein